MKSDQPSRMALMVTRQRATPSMMTGSRATTSLLLRCDILTRSRPAAFAPIVLSEQPSSPGLRRRSLVVGRNAKFKVLIWAILFPKINMHDTLSLEAS